MYQDLLQALTDSRIELVDNQDFMLWAQLQPGELLEGEIGGFRPLDPEGP